jgi:hypothetical protein
MNTKILDNFVTFLTMGRTQNFDLKLRSYGQLNLGNRMRYGFLIQS